MCCSQQTEADSSLESTGTHRLHKKLLCPAMHMNTLQALALARAALESTECHWWSAYLVNTLCSQDTKNPPCMGDQDASSSDWTQAGEFVSKAFTEGSLEWQMDHILWLLD